MPQFAPGETRVAVATVKVQPAGLACESELWLGDGAKATTSGLISFTSTGSPQEVRHPIVMPSGGTFYPNLVIYTEGKPALVYRHPEAVSIISILFPEDFAAAQTYLELIDLQRRALGDLLDGWINQLAYDTLYNAFLKRWEELHAILGVAPPIDSHFSPTRGMELMRNTLIIWYIDPEGYFHGEWPWAWVFQADRYYYLARGWVSEGAFT